MKQSNKTIIRGQLRTIRDKLMGLQRQYKGMNSYKGLLLEDTSNLRQSKIGLYNTVINLEKRVY